jgi:hypothetical protein
MTTIAELFDREGAISRAAKRIIHSIGRTMEKPARRRCVFGHKRERV